MSRWRWYQNLNEQLRNEAIRDINETISDINNDNEASEQDSYDDEEDEDARVDFDKGIIRRMKSNDPSITAINLYMGPKGEYDDEWYFDALGINWELEGKCIAENTHLHSLSILGNPSEEGHTGSAIANAKAFYNALSKNTSIKSLTIGSSPLSVGVTLEMLSVFFEHNQNLRNLDINNLNKLNGHGSRLLMSALAKCNKKSMRKINFDLGMDDDSAANLVTVLGRFHNLRELKLNFNQRNEGEKWCFALARLLRNPIILWCDELDEMLQNPMSKLEILDLSQNDISDKGADALGRGLEKNVKLKKLTLDEIGSITSSGWIALLEGQSKSKSSLEELQLLDIQSMDIGDEESLALAATIIKCRTVKSLEFCDTRNYQCVESSSISTSGWIALFKTLLNPDCSVLEKINFFCNNINDEGLSVLGRILGNNSTLKSLNLGSSVSITATGWATFFESLSLNSSLENLEVEQDNYIDDRSMVVLANTFGNRRQLKGLNLCYTPSISTNGWQTFFNMSQTCLLALEELDLGSNEMIDDTIIHELVTTLGNSSSLISLRLADNRSITYKGWMAVSTLLQQPGSRLTKLRIGNDYINDAVAISFANALINNTGLKMLDFVWSLGQTITSRGWTALANSLCNKSSIESIHASNHTLQDIGWDSEHPYYLTSLVELNKNENKAEVARQKLIRYHFLNGGNIIVDELVDLDVVVLPLAIAWISRDATCQSLLFKLFQSIPTLFDFDKKAKSVSKSKRKRG